MNEERFWEVVQHAHDLSDDDMDGKCRLIRAAVSKLPPDDAKAFLRLFDVMTARAYSWRLWGAAYVIHGGCSDDAFSDFRASLISRGRHAFEKALLDPDSLASEDFDEDAWFYEGYQYAIADGVKASVGSVPARDNLPPENPSGQEWSEETVYELYPKLSAKFA